uniref:Lachrymatory-factor synthase n=1 Tax=Arundo donax TaxID=35708 RepID=A0A0A9CUI7_ARUDO
MATESATGAALGGGMALPPPQSKAWEWEGRVVSAVPAATADEAWALLSDFLAFHRWHPRVAACRLAAGTPRSPGCVRYCEGTTDGGDGAAPPDWAHETLLEYDPAARFFRYEMNDNNMGFGAFFATFRVVPGSGEGCELRWEFECEPLRGTPREALEARLQAGLDGMAARVRDHVLAARAGAVAAGGLEAADEFKLGNSIAV